MPATTALDLITHAFETASIQAPGESLSAQMAADGLRRLNLMMGALQLQPYTQAVLRREEFDLVSGQGGPSNPYTIGDGGDFDVSRPPTLSSVSILIVAEDDANNVEVPRALLTDDAWEAIHIKELQSSVFTDVYYNPTYSDDLGTINLWPVPNTDVNKLVLYWREPLTSFADLDAEYFLPPGCEEALENNLAKRFLAPYGITDGATVAMITDMAQMSLGTFKRGNVRMSDLATDPALTREPGGYYNILTGSGGGTGV